MKLLLRAGLVGSLVLTISMVAAASSIWTEGDNSEGGAGGQIKSANVTVGFGSLTEIIGTLGDVTAGSDLYEIYISDPSTFSATTTGNGSKPVVDPALYLFNASGAGLFGNDNISGTDFQAQIPVGTTSSLTAGLYYILIAPSGHLPEDKNGNSIFGAITGQTEIFDGSGTLKEYGGTPSADDAGKGYTIQLTGAEFAYTPEPGSLTFVGFGVAMLAWNRGKRQRDARRS